MAKLFVFKSAVYTNNQIAAVARQIVKHPYTTMYSAKLLSSRAVITSPPPKVMRGYVFAGVGMQVDI